MTFLLNQLIISFYNFINSRIDAYRIMKNKSIAHGVNFSLYAIFVVLLIWLFGMNIRMGILFGFSSFFNRQLSFDIPLNLRRGLPWYYQSMANPPKAWWDKIERKLFGIEYNGKHIVLWYSIMFLFSLIIAIV